MSTSPRLPRWFLKLSFRLLYNELAWTYEGVAWLVSFGQWAAWRRAAMLFLEQGPLLEMGYGTGCLMADMAAQGLSPVGIDLSPYMARLARHRLLQKGALPQLVRGQAQYLPFPDASFTNLVATFPTDYILDPETLTAIGRVLQPGGRLIIVVMGYLQGPGPLRRFIDWLYHITGQREIPEPKPLARLKEFGFIGRWEDIEHENARVRLLVATHEQG